MATSPVGTSRSIEIALVRSRRELEAHIPAWDKLAAEALEANIFYESAMLLAALDNMGPAAPFCFVLVYMGGMLIGLFPFWLSRKGPRGVIRTYLSLLHLNCYLATPLVHRAHARAAIDAVLDWLDTAPGGVRALGFYRVGGNTAFGSLLRERLRKRWQPNFVESSHRRAFFEPAATAEAYLSHAISTKKRKEYRRQRRRLEELGTLTFSSVTGEEGAAQWAEAFLDMEMRSWKGRGGAALGAIPGGRAYFTRLIPALAGEGRVDLQTMALDGRPIALKCNLIGAGGPPAGSFAYKITFDEDYARFSPGVLLELHNIERLHDRRDSISWMDSCADPDHPMIDHLWPNRRDIIYLTCGSRGLPGRLIVAALRWRNRRIRARLSRRREEQ